MSTALIGAAHFRTRDDGSSVYEGPVSFNVLTPQVANSSFTVVLQVTDTLATLQARVLAAIDAEAVKMGFLAPTAVFGATVIQVR
jgi:hypothetical protein